jgi:hypothetical protein
MSTALWIVLGVAVVVALILLKPAKPRQDAGDTDHGPDNDRGMW